MANNTRTVSRQFPPTPAHAGRTPAGPVLVLVFTLSLGTAIVQNGIFFLTRERFGFGPASNFALGVALGLSYVAGALLANRLQRQLRVSSRALLACLMLGIALASALPIITATLGREQAIAATWLLVLIYGPLTGVAWPLIESFLSGGRRERDLRRATGAFNITWSGSMVLAFWAMAPLVEPAPLLVLALFATVLLVATCTLRAFGSEPGTHLEEQPHVVHERYPALLRAHRLLLPGGYLVLAAITPYLAAAMHEPLTIPTAWQTPVVSIWLLARFLGFLLLDRWHGWHGRGWLPAASGALLILGMALTVLMPLAPVRAAAIAGLTLGLGLLGLASAGIYCGAIYYAMAVGDACVDQGGRHEAIIGLGYAGGPLCGLAALALHASGVLPIRWETTLVVLVGAILLILAGVACRPSRTAPA